MGAAYTQAVLPDQSHDELIATWEAIVEQCLYDYGHSCYSGSFAEKDGLQILSKAFLSTDEAEEYIIEHNDKWGPAMAARVVVKEGYGWYIGGWCNE